MGAGKGILGLFAALSIAAAAFAQVADEGRVWDFDADSVGTAPAGFIFTTTGKGAPGEWVVRTESAAPSGSQALLQVSADPAAERFPMAIVGDFSLQDLRASVRCKPISGTIDQACGLVFRYRDENNYYVARANALEGTVTLFAVTKGRLKQIRGWFGTVASGVWHHLSITAHGKRMAVYWDGTQVITIQDETFAEAGSVGMWTKADSVTAFDDLAAVPYRDTE